MHELGRVYLALLCFTHLPSSFQGRQLIYPAVTVSKCGSTLPIQVRLPSGTSVEKNLFWAYGPNPSIVDKGQGLSHQNWQYRVKPYRRKAGLHSTRNNAIRDKS